MRRPAKRALDALPATCRGCSFQAECGGSPDFEASFWGCFDRCVTVCRQKGCDLVCPLRTVEFWQACQETGGLIPNVPTLLPVPLPLPSYLPVVHHRSAVQGPLEVGPVAVPLGALFRLEAGRQVLVAGDAAGLREHFRLQRDTPILVVSVGHDRSLERYWAARAEGGLAERFARLGLLGVTTPNYSFFSNVPRPYTLWNRARSLVVGGELSAAGVPVALHVNALLPQDWDFWLKLLRSQPTVRVVVKEFQTGARYADRARLALEGLRRLQYGCGRDLHPIIVGGGAHLRELERSFKSFTSVDSTPFLKAQKRHRALPDGRGWERVTTGRGEPIDDILAANIQAQARRRSVGLWR